MANLGNVDKQILEKLFQMSGGYVLNFSDRTMGEFFVDDMGININDEKYNYDSGSKANRMRAFWRLGNDILVGKAISKLIDYIEVQILLINLKKEDFPQELINKGKEISNRLLGIKLQSINDTDNKEVKEVKEDDFLNREFKDIKIDKLGLDGIVSAILRQRIDEIRKCLNVKAPLSVVFLCGSTLEGILLGVASSRAKEFNQSSCSPKDKFGKVRQLSDWSLSDFINVARELNLLGEDVKKFSHALRDFRNYIHPYRQMSENFNPNDHTAKICWQVLQAAIVELSK